MKCKNSSTGEHDFQYNRLHWRYECVNCDIKYNKDIHSLKDPKNDNDTKTDSTTVDKR